MMVSLLILVLIPILVLPHTSIALLDAVKAINPLPVIEVHLSDINEREEFRKISYISMACKKQIKGLGSKGYLVAIENLINE